MSKAILYDATLCIGCLECERGCAESNGLPYDDTIAATKKQSETKFTYVMDGGDEKFMRRLCMHCEDPTCASVCPVAALQKTPEGPVAYLEERCMGCRYCMVACPFGVPKYEWSEAFLPRVRKCTMCTERVKQGKVTACTEACPTEATKFGERDELIAEAKKRIAENPGQYVDHIFGVTEVGGTSVLMLSSVPFEKFGFRSNYEQAPMPQLTWSALKHVPDVAVFGSVLLGGIYWITNRREDVAAAEGTRHDEKK